jgi:hypothetical protein
MITYLSYRINRENLEEILGQKKTINEKKISADKYEKYLQLITLDELNTFLA